MKIPVNKDLDSFPDDFFKGLTLKQTAACAAALLAGTAMYLLGSFIFHLPASACFYLALPAVLPIAAAGFLKISGMTPAAFFKARREVMRQGIYFFEPDLFPSDNGCELDSAGREGEKEVTEDG